MDINAIYTGIAGIVAGVGGAITFAKRIETKVLPLIHDLISLYDHLKENKELATALNEAKQTVETESTTERDALIKSSIHCAIAALGVEVAKLTDIQKAAITKYVSDVVPDQFKQEITPQRIESTLTLIQQELDAAKQHDGMKAAQALIEWIDASKVAV